MRWKKNRFSTCSG